MAIATPGPQCAPPRRRPGYVCRRVAAALAVALLFCVAPRAHAGDPSEEDGAAAPEGTWLMEGGCASRTAFTRTPPPTPPLERAWELEPGGRIVGEPLAHGPWSIVETEVKGGRQLVLVRISDGSVIDRQRFETKVPLRPKLSGRLVAAQTGKETIGLWRFGERGLQHVLTMDFPMTLNAGFLLHEDELYAVQLGTIGRYELGGDTGKPMWSVGESFGGRISLRGDYVYVTASLGAILYAFHRDTGRSRGDRVFVMGPKAWTAEIAVHARSVVVHSEEEVMTTSGWPANTSSAARAVDGKLGPKRGLMATRSRTASWGDGWVGLVVADGRHLQIHRTLADGRYYTTASDEKNPWLLGSLVSPSRARDVIFFGPNAVDVEEPRRLFKIPTAPYRRVVPARGALLCVEGSRALAAIRSAVDDPDAGAAWSSPPTDENGTPAVFRGRAALSDGTLVKGAFRLPADGSRIIVEQGKERREIAGSDLQLVETAAGRIVAGSDVAGMLRGLAIFDNDDRAQAYVGLLGRAMASKDTGLMRQIAARACMHGAEVGEVAAALKKARGYRKLRRLPKTKKSIVDEVRARLDEIETRGRPSLWTKYEQLPEATPPMVRVELLRALASQDAASPKLRPAVVSLLPKGIEPPEPFLAREWLDFVEAAHHTGVRLMPPPRPPSEDLEPGERTLGALLHSWRPDLRGFESDQLMVVTTLKRPGSLARCLSLGELVCDMLESWCARGKRRRATRLPMTLLLYETEEEYRLVSRNAVSAGRVRSSLEWADGHYSPGDALSRMYLPSDDVEFRRVMRVFAHELTHQWVAERCPLFGAIDRGGARRSEHGYWVVEGFAELVEGFRLDLRNRTWEFDPHAGNLDFVANASGAELLKWDFVLSAGYDAMIALGPKPGSRKLSELRAFYAQSAAVATYLFQANDGAQRDKLLTYLAEYYKGDAPAIRETFGITMRELGTRTVAWAQDLQNR